MLKNSVTRVKKIAEKLTESDEVDFEFPFFMVYLHAITSGTLSRLIMLRLAAEKIIFHSTSKYLNHILDLTENWRYSQSKASEIVSETVPTDEFKDFLYKFSQSVSVGEPTDDFIKMYYKNWVAEYEASRLQDLDKLKNLSDAYLPLMSVTLFMSTTMLFSSIFYEGETMIVLTILVVIVISFLLYLISWLIFQTARPDNLLLDKQKEKSRKRVKVELIGLASVTLGVLIIVLPIGSNFQKLIFTGLSITIGGAVGKWYIGKVKQKEKDYPAFFRYISSNLGANIPLIQVIDSARETDFGSLNDAVEILYNKLKMRVKPKVAWWSFETELDSNLIRKINLIMTDTLATGGDIEKASKVIEEFHHIYTTVRRKRYSACSYHIGILIPLYVVMASLFGVIDGFFSALTVFLGKLESVVDFISIPSVEFMRLFFLFSLIIFALNNVFSLYNMEGDSRFTILFYLGIQLALGGAFYLGITSMVTKYLSSVAYL
jgi:archaellum biogenesis protein FlaJ (TadC family)